MCKFYCCLQSTSPSLADAAFARRSSRLAVSTASTAGGFSYCSHSHTCQVKVKPPPSAANTPREHKRRTTITSVLWP